MMDKKTLVRDFWGKKSCGEIYADGHSEREYYDSHSKTRYFLEPYILDFAKFHEGKEKVVLEIGVGMGADHIHWAQSGPKSIFGLDLTQRAVDHTNKRLAVYGLKSDVRVSDAENLPFNDNSFDIVYSWGVIHTTPDTPRAVREIYRVLRPGGIARIMIYHKYSLVGIMLWMRYGLFRGRPFRSLSDIYANHLESPGTKAYSVAEAKELFKDFNDVDIKIQLTYSDLLEGGEGQQHRGPILTIAKKLWPRFLLRKICKNFGIDLLIEARKIKFMIHATLVSAHDQIASIFHPDLVKMVIII